MSPFVNLGFGDIQWATGNLEYDYYADYGKNVSPLAPGDFFSGGRRMCTVPVAMATLTGTEELSAYNDIAHYLTYGEWRMPSQAQFEALVSPTNTTSAWVTIESTKGRLITSKVNGISLFFAAYGN